MVDYLKRSDLNFKRFQTFLKTFGLVQLIHSVSCPNISSSSCIDWIVSNCRFVNQSDATNNFISDHFVIELDSVKSLLDLALIQMIKLIIPTIIIRIFMMVYKMYWTWLY